MPQKKRIRFDLGTPRGGIFLVSACCGAVKLVQSRGVDNGIGGIAKSLRVMMIEEGMGAR